MLRGVPGVRRVRADRAVYEARFAAMLPAYAERYAGEALRIAAGLTRMSARGFSSRIPCGLAALRTFGPAYRNMHIVCVGQRLHGIPG